MITEDLLMGNQESSGNNWDSTDDNWHDRGEKLEFTDNTKPISEVKQLGFSDVVARPILGVEPSGCLGNVGTVLTVPNRTVSFGGLRLPSAADEPPYEKNKISDAEMGLAIEIGKVRRKQDWEKTSSSTKTDFNEQLPPTPLTKECYQKSPKDTLNPNDSMVQTGLFKVLDSTPVSQMISSLDEGLVPFSAVGLAKLSVKTKNEAVREKHNAEVDISRSGNILLHYSKDPSSSCLEKSDIDRLEEIGKIYNNEGILTKLISEIGPEAATIGAFIVAEPCTKFVDSFAPGLVDSSEIAIKAVKATKVTKEKYQSPNASDIVSKCLRTETSSTNRFWTDKLSQDMNSIPDDPAASSGGAKKEFPGNELGGPVVPNK